MHLVICKHPNNDTRSTINRDESDPDIKLEHILSEARMRGRINDYELREFRAQKGTLSKLY
jgi:hypothetical protein